MSLYVIKQLQLTGRDDSTKFEFIRDKMIATDWPSIYEISKRTAERLWDMYWDLGSYFEQEEKYNILLEFAMWIYLEQTSEVHTTSPDKCKNF